MSGNDIFGFICIVLIQAGGSAALLLILYWDSPERARRRDNAEREARVRAALAIAHGHAESDLLAHRD